MGHSGSNVNFFYVQAEDPLLYKLRSWISIFIDPVGGKFEKCDTKTVLKYLREIFCFSDCFFSRFAHFERYYSKFYGGGEGQGCTKILLSLEARSTQGTIHENSYFLSNVELSVGKTAKSYALSCVKNMFMLPVPEWKCEADAPWVLGIRFTAGMEELFMFGNSSLWYSWHAEHACKNSSNPLLNAGFSISSDNDRLYL